jgi:hypothetical protein
VIIGLSFTVATAQLQHTGTYPFQQFVGQPYQPISGGTQLNFGASDDMEYQNLPIGFPFVFRSTNGPQTVTTFSASDNGFIWFGSGLVTSLSSVFSNATANVIGIVAPLNFDLHSGDAPDFGILRYETVGSSPNRVLIVQ